MVPFALLLAREIAAMSVAQYELSTLLRKDDVGEVWQALDQQLKREVAIRIIPEARPSFLREARLAARLNHPNIAAIFGVEEQESALYLVMELVRGTPLDRVIAKGPLAAAEAVAIMREVAEAVDEAHDHGIVHRDLKPENIILGAQRVKVVGFGIARDSGTAQSDVVALGAILYEMLSGSKPAATPAPLKHVSAALAAAVDRCLANGFRSAGDFAKALSAAELVKPAGRALVVDDDAVTRAIIRAGLEEIGYEVDEAVDGSEAIRLLKGDPYALMICDLLMPRLDGWNVLDFLRGSAARRPSRIFVTSAMEAVTLGARDQEIVQGVIPKPITAAKLKELL